MVATLEVVAAAIYAGAALVYGASLAEGRRVASWAGSVLILLAVFLHAAAVAGYVTTFGELPLVGLAPSLSTFAFLLGLTALGASALEETRPIALVLLPIVVVLQTVAAVLGVEPAGEAMAFRGAWFGLHVLLAFVGYAGLSVAFAAGLLYLLQFRELKVKRFGRMFRFFPSLETLDRLGRWSLVVGFPALTLGLVIGWGWAARFDQEYGPGNPKVLWGVITWLVFVAALTSRLTGSRRDRRGALVSVVGFVFVIVTYVVLRLLMPDGRFFL